MEVVQIVGPSFSGSTLLGNVLNAHPGYFFGSEVYRLLPGGPSKGLRVGCESCGLNCAYWNSQLRARILERPDASQARVYGEFSREHSDVKTFVDGSKSLRWYKSDWRECQLVSAKHPLRLVSSSLYNRSDLIGIGHNTPFDEFKNLARGDFHKFSERIDAVLDLSLAAYLRILDAVPRGLIVQTDRLIDDDFAVYRALCGKLGVAPDSEAVTHFTRHPVHPIGGNKAPMWQRRSRDGQERLKVDRAKFYTSMANSDYRVDDKFRQLLPTDLIGYIREQSSYQELCTLLGYSQSLN